MIKQTPSWTMTSRKFYTHQEITPGPGAYSNPSSSPGPIFKIGTSPRLFLGNNDLTPGPGSYSPQKMLPAQPKAYMPSSNRSEMANKNKVPGPGSYLQFTKSDAPSFSLRGRSQDTQSNENPKLGPGHYDPVYSTTIEKSPSYKVGTSKRNLSMASTLNGPGPANYSPKSQDQSFIHHFGNSARSVSYDNKLPGPGAYEVRPISNNISFSMAPRRSSQIFEKTPGPGSYSSNSTFYAPNYSLSRSPRKPIVDDNHLPGPGSYSPIDLDTKKKPSFPIAPRETMEKDKKIPGPADYSPNFPQTKLSFSLRSRPCDRPNDFVPGPGKYNPNQDYVLEASPNFGIGKSQKSFGSSFDGNPNPGPGTYLKKSTLSGPKWGFGSGPRVESKKDEVPGPGSYSLK